MSEQLENEQPSSLRLVRRDQEHRMARFYTMHVAQTLFGGWDLVREWSRIGSPEPCASSPSRHWRSPNAPCGVSKSKSENGDICRDDDLR